MSDAIFPNDESKRGRLANGEVYMPRPHFVQPDNGPHSNSDSDPLGISYDPTRARVKSSNQETDISGGLF